MPVTPYHFGVGLLLKGVAPARVSILTFMAAQVVIDLESGYYMLQRSWPFHRELHTLALATPLGAGVGLAMWCIGRAVPVFRLRYAPEFSLLPALLAGALGGASHAVLDGIMHEDALPFAPFSFANPLLHLVGYTGLEALCLIFGVLGTGLWVLRESRPGDPVQSKGAVEQGLAADEGRLVLGHTLLSARLRGRRSWRSAPRS